MKTATNAIDTISTGLAPVLNLSDSSTAGTLAMATLCETVKIAILDLTPEVRGQVYQIPVNFIDEPSMEAPIGFLEEVVNSGTATKAEFRYLRKLCKFLSA